MTTEKDIKRLYRSKEEKVIAGVCGGIAEYFNVDPLWPRLVAILLVFLDGIGILIYIILWVLMPENPKQKSNKKTIVEAKVSEVKETIKHEFNEEKKKKAKKHNIKEEEVIEKYTLKKHHQSNSNIIIGSILILLGVLFLAKEFFWDFVSKLFWPALIIGIGVILLFRR